jgi:hypothetical protein
MQPRLERFEPRNLLNDRFGDPSRPPRGDNIQGGREEPEHALLLETARELPHRLGMGVGFLGPLRRSTPLEEDEGPDEFVTPLELIDKAEFELGKVRHRFHQCALPLRQFVPLPAGHAKGSDGLRGTLEACLAGRGQTAWIACRVEGTYCNDT